MTTFVSQPRPRHARAGANPTLEMLEYIRSALTSAGEPISRNQLLSVLSSWGHTTTRRSLNAALSFFREDAIVLEGPHGLVWAPTASPEVLAELRVGRRF